ncbi:MAG TPA: hypothetical protein VMV31_00655 [Terriglobales bacterium]|nr:hypothetical protein [Terriglobales bacterium]
MGSVSPSLIVVAGESFADLDREWSAFFKELEANRHDPARWFTPERARQVEALLQRGQRWLQSGEHPHPERQLYAMHLRRLLPALQQLMQELTEVAARLQHEQEHLQSVRAWAGSQGRRR